MRNPKRYCRPSPALAITMKPLVFLMLASLLNCMLEHEHRRRKRADSTGRPRCIVSKKERMRIYTPESKTAWLSARQRAAVSRLSRGYHSFTSIRMGCCSTIVPIALTLYMKIDSVMKPSLGAIAVGSVPFVAVCFSVPLWDRVHPMILGLPFNFFWLILWIPLTPLIMSIAYRLEKRRSSQPPSDGKKGDMQ